MDPRHPISLDRKKVPNIPRKNHQRFSDESER
jgi:hypothetical protein